MRVKLIGNTIELSFDVDDLSGKIRHGYSYEREGSGYEFTINTPQLPKNATMHLEVPLTPEAVRALGKQAKYWSSVAKKIEGA